jgi:protein TonB
MSVRTAEPRFGALSGMASRMILVAAFHAALLLLLAGSFGIVSGPKQTPPMEGGFIDQAPPEEAPLPPVTGPQFTDPTIHIAPPEEIVFDADPPPVLVVEHPPRIDGGEGGSAVPPPMIQGVRMDARHPLSQPYYPPDVIRAGGEGSLALEIYVLPSGRVGDARILRSSGFDSLDRAALQEAKRNWRLLPATRNGEPFAQWYSLRVVFKLENQR